MYGRNIYNLTLILSWMVEVKYYQVSLPEDLIFQIDKEINGSKSGYRSRAEFVKDAIREKLEGASA